ncbi:MAG: hypothetical protein L0241_00925 [Planctomycetia bacterium]|nr:hypothetical protein [Planctomycetia bacterium]
MRKAYHRLVSNLPGDSFYHRARGGGLFRSLVRILARRK